MYFFEKNIQEQTTVSAQSMFLRLFDKLFIGIEISIAMPINRTDIIRGTVHLRTPVGWWIHFIFLSAKQHLPHPQIYYTVLLKLVLIPE